MNRPRQRAAGRPGRETLPRLAALAGLAAGLSGLVGLPTLLTAGGAALLCSGCTTPTSGSGARLDATRGEGVRSSRTRVAPGQNGLEVVTWQVTDDGTRLAEALRKHAVPAVAAMDDPALRANGFVVWPVRASQLDALMVDLGGSPMDVRTWLGAAPTWRELIAAPAGDGLVEVNGVARERAGATARLMARSWPVPMEDGGRIAVDLVPQIVTDAAQASLVRNGERLAGELVMSCAIELEMERDIAWVITCDPRGVVELELPLLPSPEELGSAGAEGMTGAESTLGADGVAGVTGADGVAGTSGAADLGARAPVGGEPAPAPDPEHAPAPAPAQEDPSPPPAPAPLPPPPTLAPAPKERAPIRTRKPITDPPLEAPKRTPAQVALAIAALGARQNAGPPASAPPPPPAPEPEPEAPVPPKSGKMTPRVTTLGAMLLLASPERAGMPARRTVLILVPHLDAMPFPAETAATPMSKTRK